MPRKVFRLYTYDVWGNSEDGYNVNDVFRTADTIELDTDWSDTRVLAAVAAELGTDVTDIEIDNGADFGEGHIELVSVEDGKPLGYLEATDVPNE